MPWLLLGLSEKLMRRLLKGGHYLRAAFTYSVWLLFNILIELVCLASCFQQLQCDLNNTRALAWGVD